MSSHAVRRFVLAGLLAAATLLFAVGVIAERSVTDEHTGPAVSAEASEPGHTEVEGQAGEGAHADEATASTPAESAEAGRERVLGVDIESTPLIVLAVLAGLALSAAAATDLGRRRAFLLAVALIALAWAALDVREVLHQIDESREGIAAVAVAVAVLHLLAATVAGRRASGAPPALA
jgi:hypothetical protein